MYATVESPAVDLFQIEAPISAELERRDLPVFQQPIQRGRMNVEVLSDLSDRKNFLHSVHLNCLFR
jgi:hypothetical protein